MYILILHIRKQLQNEHPSKKKKPIGLCLSLGSMMAGLKRYHQLVPESKTVKIWPD